ncbi:MAG: 2-polyprenyl-6-methoxyphenol hydroxylase-like oxidoreductase [Mycobacterium sp.]
MARAGEHAVVLGGSMAGLFAARALTESYDRVTVLERDLLSDGVEARHGVPQGKQPHLLLARCAQVAEELFPGILDELVADGGRRWDDGDLSRFHLHFGGHRIVNSGRIPDPASLINHLGSRPFVEAHVRRRVRALPAVTVLDGHDIADLEVRYEPGGGRIIGVRAQPRNGQASQRLAADLVVDASGRGSRTPVFLEEWGYGRPAVEELTVRVAYASMPVRIPRGAVHEDLIVRPFEPGRPRGFAMFRCENDTWLVAAATLGEAVLPRTLPELLEFGSGAAPDRVLAAVRSGEPLGGICVHRYPSNRWRRYDRMRRFPRNLVVVGDAFCSFNPIYGQGMTVAALEALILRDCLRGGLCELPERFFAAAAKSIRVAWQMAVGSDLALPEIEGARPLSMRLTNAYLDRVLRAAESDVLVAQEFLRVTGMVSPPSRLVHPAVVSHVVRANLRRRVREPATPVAAPVRLAGSSPSS